MNPFDPRTARKAGEAAAKEVGKLWLRKGERLLLTLPPLFGYSGALIGGVRGVPHVAPDDLPALRLDRCRWPLPADGDLEWTEDPTVAYWAEAADRRQDAVRFLDGLAASRGIARFTMTTQRVALLLPAGMLTEPGGRTGLVELYEVEPGRVRGLRSQFLGRSVPPVRTVTVDFADGSTLWLRDRLAAEKVAAALSR
ncbi:hypothetical protein [Amycolatopsis suaedae]|uniref:Uncharacterized protein n=1 Tax=Amycolatopsis suaedae TaxID=2510978 RepID=A0A4Q7J5R4_9PSEU|nr:hypothetical protein [Amycolatopsis suaedae]RZQ62042.1 hypothetical protein EWH70_20845 [Amycolatopsis suaedae]